MARMHFTDFNRLGWGVCAWRINPSLRMPTVRSGELQTVFDSTWLGRNALITPDRNAQVVLWDGLTGLGDLNLARPDLRAREDLRFRYVGVFEEVRAGFPFGSEPLFPASEDAFRSFSTAGVRVPAWVDALAAIRAFLRPLKNARLAPTVHQRLTRGGCLVFCGLVRPGTASLDSLVRGTSLAAIRGSLAAIEDLDWRVSGEVTWAAVRGVYCLLRRIPILNPSDAAAQYTLVATLHRLATLFATQAFTGELVVNEFGVHPHFDPYDATAYRNNVFIDFGSTRGAELIYPRMVDQFLQNKPVASVRFLTAGIRLADFLAETDETAFRELCTAHARFLVLRLRGLTR